MRRFRSHRVGVAHGSVPMFAHFGNDGPMWAKAGPRAVRRPVRFEAPFRSPPVVQVTISMWDTDGGRNQRADIAAEAIGTEGFDLVFRTWADSRVARIRADWMAMGEVDDDEDWDV